ncbi:MAG: isoamylase early set domain-containing protein [Gemmatimonadota bacterium]
MADSTGERRAASDADDGGDDEVVQRVRATLAPLPASDPAAIARILSAVHSRAPSRWGRVSRMSRVSRTAGGWARSPYTIIAGSTLLAAAAVSIFFVRTDELPGDATTAPMVASQPSVPHPSSSTPPTPPTQPTPSAAAVQPAGTRADPEAVVPVQFVLDLATARSVSVVGDFNDWNTTATPMERLPGSTVWTASLSVRPGRHEYSFVVDGTRWIADPRAPRAADSDFGKPGSVLLAVPR